MTITPEDERRYRLTPLPDVPFPGAEEAARRRDEYESARRQYRAVNPHRDKADV